MPAGCCSALYPIIQAQNTHPKLIRKDNLLWVRTLSEDSRPTRRLQGMKPLIIGEECLHYMRGVRSRKGDPTAETPGLKAIPRLCCAV